MKINAKLRDTGKKKAKELRKNNKIPAILYGKGFDSISLTLDYKEFYHYYKDSIGHQNFVFLKVKDKEYRSLVKDMQLDPLSRKVIHIDFQEIYAGQKIEVKIPIAVIGDAPGLKEGGIIEMNLRELQIRCLPKDLPDSLEVDISKLQIGDSIHLKDVINQIPNIEILQSAETSIVSIIMPKAEKVVEVEEEVEELAEEEKVEEAAKEEKKESEEGGK